MIRSLLILVVVLSSAAPASAQLRRFRAFGPHVNWSAGPGSFSLNIGSPYGGFHYHGAFPYPRHLDPYVYGRSYDGYVSPHGTYYNPQSRYTDYYLPPIHYPAELMYGPLAMRRFMGLDRAPVPAAPPAVVAPADPAAEALPAPKVRESNLAARERAQHFLAAGDRLFREQKHHDALQRYKTAAEAAPDVADAYFRQGFALVATNRYDLAADGFRRGLALEPSWAESLFRLDELYGDADLAKQAHLDALARAALDNPNDADLMFVLGVFLHFDGQADRARRFFVRARELAGDAAPHLDGFLAAAP
ncbi:MAG: hypothetical protein KY475_08975 [Planctomycetes bacterium]|nr:hypothetical protein [Planctomycetota bacterium]